MIRRVLVQRDAHKAPQRQRVRQPPGNSALRPDALEIPDQQRPKVKSPASATGARTSPHKTSRTGPQQTRRSPRPPAVHSAADRMDAPEPMPAPYVRSTNLLASPAACASPSPCADSTNQACGYLNSFWLTNPNLHHGLLAGEKQ